MRDVLTKRANMFYAFLPQSSFSVEETAARLSVYAHVFTRTTRLLASWTADIPELEAKMLAGEHLYRDALSLNALCVRLKSLARDFEPSTQLPADWASRLAALAAASDTMTRLHGMYAVVKFDLYRDIRQHIAATDHFLDGPTVMVLSQIAEDLQTQMDAAAHATAQTGQLCHLSPQDGDARAAWKRALDQPPGSKPVVKAARPARDGRFRVVDRAPFPGFGGVEDTKVALHSMMMGIEIGSMEVCGRMIVDFPDMPLDFLLDIGRQCWDESRHSYLCYRRFAELGGTLGEFPTDMVLWDLCDGLPLAVRLAACQRIGEWLGVDGAILNGNVMRATGDEITTRLFDYVTVDEITHVGFGNRWIRYLTLTDEGVAQAHALASKQRQKFGSAISGPPELPFNHWACQRAGFTPAEIDALERSRQPDVSPLKL